MYTLVKHSFNSVSENSIVQFRFDDLLKSLINQFKVTHQPEILFQIYKLTYCHVYDYIFNLTGSEQQAVYFVQKTFQNFSQKIVKYQNEENLMKWLDDKTIEEMTACGYQMQLFPDKINQAI